jgi:hypothetical protein
VTFPRWELYAASLYVDFEAQPSSACGDFFRDFGRFRDFVEETPPAERVPLLLFAYERLRGSMQPGDSERQKYFWHEAYGILIHYLLAANLKPSEAEACQILHAASHFHRDGEEMLPPVELAEKAFRHRPYSADLFAAARDYRERLCPFRSRHASQARSRLDLLLWHDVAHPSKGCWTSRIQRAIAAMSADEAFAWQWLLRNTSRGLWNSVGKTWSEEAKRRFAELGEERFLRGIGEWLVFTGGERLRLSKPGSHMLCLLVLYAGLADSVRTLPILTGLAAVHWSQRERMQRVVEALLRM